MMKETDLRHERPLRVPCIDADTDWQPESGISEPLYMQLAGRIRDDILCGSLFPGDRLPSTTKLCSKFNVAIDTLQRSLSILSEEGFIERVPRMGTYVVDRAGRKSICLIIGRNIFSDENFASHSAVFSSFCQQALDAGLHVETRIVTDDHGFGRKIAGIEKDMELDRYGVVCVICSNHPLGAWLCSQCRLPVVLKGGEVDIYNLGYRGVNYLSRQGYTGIKVILPCQERTEANPTLAGVLDALADCSMESSYGVFIETDDATERAGYEKIRELYRNGGIGGDCLFSLNDNITRGVILGLLEAGKNFPRDLGLLTHSNKGLDILSPVPLTRLELDPADFARQMLKNCFRALNKQQPESPAITFKLVKGESCGENINQKGDMK